jgi:hypothetical protein
MALMSNSGAKLLSSHLFLYFARTKFLKMPQELPLRVLLSWEIFLQLILGE